MPAINPYLTFDGNCDEAFEFYRSVFGGDFALKMRMKDVDSGHPVPSGSEDKIMHVSLPIGEGTVLMASDAIAGYGPPLNIGTNFSISINAGSVEESDRLFAGLSAGGTVTMPMEKTFWGAYFGMFVDKFGIQWMVNFDEQPHK